MTTKQIKEKLEAMTKEELEENLRKLDEELKEIENTYEKREFWPEEVHLKYRILVREHNMTWRKLNEGKLKKMTYEDWD